MTQTNLSPSKETSAEFSQRQRNAYRIAAAVLGAAIMGNVFNLFIAWQLGVWQIYTLVGAILVFCVFVYMSMRIIRSGRVETGVWIFTISTFALFPIGALLISDLGLIVGLIMVVTSYLYASQTLQTKDVRRVLTASIVVGALTALTDFLPLDYRLQVPALQTFAPLITALVLSFIGFFVVRRAWGRSMRNKLLVAFIGVTLAAAGALAAYAYVSANNILRNGLEGELTQHTDGVAVSIGDLLDAQINTMTTLSLNEVLQQTVEDTNKTYEGSSSAIQATLDARDAQWRAADAADNNNAPLVREYLNNQAALELREFQRSFPNNAEVFITDVYGGQAGTTNRTSDYLQSDESWWQAAYNNGQGAVYISEPEYDESAGALAVLIALPLRNRDTGEIVGILRTTYLASALNAILSEPVGKTGETDVFVPGEVVYHFHNEGYTPVEPEVYTALQAVADQGMVEMDYEDTASIIVQIPMKSPEGNQAVDNLGWVVLFHQQQDEAFAPISAQTRGTLTVVVIVLLFAAAAAFGLSVFLVRPITQLTQTAEEVSAGNLNSRATVTSADEVGILASTFNSMTSQLQETLSGLEQRVAARTRDLAIVAEVGTATSSIQETKRLLQEVVDLTKERFNLYHSHIYLLDEQARLLVLTAGAGEPGRVMVKEGRSIPLDREQSLVARAARERKGVTVNDVTEAPDFLPNPLLPDTRSELAVPMIVGGNMIGVFDIQSDQVGRFTESDVNIQTTLAAQLAVSIQNVRSFEQSKKQAELQSLVNVIGSRIQRSTSIEETLQTAIRELGTAIGASRVKAKIQPVSRASSTEPTSAD